MTLTCQNCGKELKGKQKKFCGLTCSHEVDREKYREVNINVGHNLPTPTVGTIAELCVATDLLTRGYEVFRALSPACSCDLAILKDGELMRVEVRSGQRTRNGGIFANISEKDAGRQDVFAVVIHSDPREIHYLTSDKKDHPVLDPRREI